MAEFMNAVVFILTLLNPFLMIVYLTDVVKKLSYPAFASILIKAGLISGAVFYIDIAGRVMALYVGTISIEMMMRGLQVWIGKLALSV